MVGCAVLVWWGGGVVIKLERQMSQSARLRKPQDAIEVQKVMRSSRLCDWELD